MEKRDELDGMVMTVSGAIKAEEMGFTLPHEHVMSTFGEAPSRYPTYPRGELLEAVYPYLARVKGLGCQTLLDCTAAYFGRHPELLREISQSSGVNILTNTGYYAAAQDRYVPEHAYHESAEQIARRWAWEFLDSIDACGIRPGFIKTAVDGGEFSALDRKLLQAAILAHKQTGLTIQTHTGDNLEAAQGMLVMLAEEGVEASAWVWVHAHNVSAVEALLDAARQGAWISLDGVNADNAAQVVEKLNRLKDKGLLNKALLSHDGDIYCAGAFRPFEYIMTGFLPRLRQEGFSEQEVNLLTVENPARAYAIRRLQAA